MNYCYRKRFKNPSFNLINDFKRGDFELGVKKNLEEIRVIHLLLFYPRVSHDLIKFKL